MRRGERLCQVPGPEAMSCEREGELRARLAGLEHGRRRTAGTGAVYAQWRGQVSRRQFRRLVEEAREEDRRQEERRRVWVEWRSPGLVWAMDDLALTGAGVMWHQVQDLGSRYKLEPAVACRRRGVLGGDEVARHLERLFGAWGAPLVLKRDNGSNLNHHEVDAVLEAHGVLALNSPPRYPRYNGGIEAGVREIRATVETLLAGLGAEAVAGLSGEVAALLNRRARPCLRGQTSEIVFGLAGAAAASYGMGDRKEVRGYVEALAEELLGRLEGDGPRARQWAWRRAIETWLQARGVIAVHAAAEVLPCFP